jgi:arginyl-tRNA synthetase
MYPLEESKQEIMRALTEALAALHFPTDVRLETPPAGMGQFAYPCFPLAPIAKQAPQAIASTIAGRLKPGHWVDHVEAHGAYVNFFLRQDRLIDAALSDILKKREAYGRLEARTDRVIVEHTSANPNGPLHVGRGRNPIIGDTLTRLFRAAGYHVSSQFYLDDMGKQVAILAWGIHHVDPKSISPAEVDKADHRLVGFYQKANELMEADSKVTGEINAIIQDLEHGEKQALTMIHGAYSPVLEGIQESLRRIHITIDSYVPESRFVLDGSVEKIVTELKRSSYCHEEEGAFYLDLETFGIHGRNTKWFFLRKDGTTLYATRDVAYHRWKATQSDRLVNVLGEDHKLESRQVEIALQLLKVEPLPQAVFYSFVSLPGGKMSTRRGRVVYLDDLIDECVERAYAEVKARRGDELTNEQMKSISEQVGIGALRYNIIKVQPEKDIVFKWEEALNFEGNAAPFIQYAHARACSILAKDVKGGQRKADASKLTHASEVLLMDHLMRLPLVIDEACQNHRPNLVANYVFETASAFNQFYRDCPVLSEADAVLRDSRLCLVEAARIVLANGLGILGIDAPEEM